MTFPKTDTPEFQNELDKASRVVDKVDNGEQCDLAEVEHAISVYRHGGVASYSFQINRLHRKLNELKNRE